MIRAFCSFRSAISASARLQGKFQERGIGAGSHRIHLTSQFIHLGAGGVLLVGLYLGAGVSDRNHSTTDREMGYSAELRGNHVGFRVS